MIIKRWIWSVCLLVASAQPVVASTITIDFDSLSEFDSVGAQIPGLSFTNATVLTAGSSLNELEFPPHSGQNVVFDDARAMSIAFTAPVYSVRGYFTYLAPLTLTAFDSSNALIGSVGSGFSANLSASGDPGSSPNELLQFGSATAIASITISGDPAGGSFVLDDLTLTDTPPTTTAVPEPGTLSLLGLGGLAMIRRLRRSWCG